MTYSRSCRTWSPSRSTVPWRSITSPTRSEHDIGADNGGDYASDYGFEPEMRPTTNVRMVFAAGADHASIMHASPCPATASVEDILAYLTGMLSEKMWTGRLRP